MASPVTEIPSHRACQHCRSQKVRCLPLESNPDVCQRCARSGRPCVFTPLQKRKQRKRTDTRVAELEREMRAMRAALKTQDEGTRSSSPTTDSPRGQPLGLWYKDRGLDAPRLTVSGEWDRVDADQVEAEIPEKPLLTRPNPVPSLWPQRPQLPESPTSNRDIIDSGLISMEIAQQLLDSYRVDLFPHYPIVYIPPSVTADELRAKQPALFLAIIAAAAGKDLPELSTTLDEEVLRSYATRTMVHSEKSLEMIQALLVSAVWYNPPNKFGQLKYYEYIHMAATMALDIGIGTRPSAHRNKYAHRPLANATLINPAEEVGQQSANANTDQDSTSLDTTNIVSRRTFLACYNICAGTSVSLRRPHTLRITSYLRECLAFLEQSPSAIPTDRVISGWTKLMMIAEEISTAFSYDDPGGIASIAELRTQLMLKDYERRLSAWYNDLPGNEMGIDSLLIMYYTIRLYLNEVALHVDHSPEDFRAPYQMSYVYHSSEQDQIPTQVLAEAIADCITSSHSLLNVFVNMEVSALRGLPVFSYVRVSFAIFVLAKLSLSASHPKSRIGAVLDRNSLKVTRMLDRSILHVRTVVDTHPCRVPAIFLALLFKLRQWCQNPEVIADYEDEPVTDAGEAVHDDMHRRNLSVTKAIEAPATVGTTASSLDSSPTHESTEQISSGTYGNFSVPATVNSSINYNPANQGASMPFNAAPYSAEQMDLDGNLVQILGDLNAFSEGGLTGLDDWGALPADFAGMGSYPGSNWQFPSGMNYDGTTM